VKDPNDPIDPTADDLGGRQALAAARAQVAAARQSVADAAQAVDDQCAIDPEPFIDDGRGASMPNPEHPVWAREVAALRVLLAEATAAAARCERLLAATEAAGAAGGRPAGGRPAARPRRRDG